MVSENEPRKGIFQNNKKRSEKRSADFSRKLLEVHEQFGIHRSVVFVNLVMKVRTGGPATVSGLGNYMVYLYFVVGAHQNFCKVSVERGQTVTV